LALGPHYGPDYNCTSHSRGFTAPACQDNLWHLGFRLDHAPPAGKREREREGEREKGIGWVTTIAVTKHTGRPFCTAADIIRGGDRAEEMDDR